MTEDQKIRFGLMALAGASVVAAGFGIHLSPLAEVAGGAGAG
jgi:hypothetical protein